MRPLLRSKNPHSPSRTSFPTTIFISLLLLTLPLPSLADLTTFPFLRTQCADPLCPKENDQTATVVTSVLNGHTTIDKIRPSLSAFCKDTTRRQEFTRSDSNIVATHKDFPSDLDWVDAGEKAQIAFEVTYGDDVDLKEALAENDEKNCLTRMGIAPTACWGGRTAKPPPDGMTLVRSSAYTIIGKGVNNKKLKRAPAPADNGGVTTLMAWKIWVKPKVGGDGTVGFEYRRGDGGGDGRGSTSGKEREKEKEEEEQGRRRRKSRREKEEKEKGR